MLIPVCAAGIAKKFAYGDTRLNFPYAHNFIVHTGSDWKIPVCMQGCANPHMHMGISVHPIPVCNRIAQISVCIQGSRSIPVCIRGLHLDPLMQTGITWHAIPVCIRGLILIPVCIRGFSWSPNAYGDWSWSPYAYGDRMSVIPECIWGSRYNPSMHTGICTIPLCIRCCSGHRSSFTAAMVVIVECDDIQCWRRRWRSSSMTVVVDRGGGGMEPTAPIVVVDGKDAIAATAIDRRCIRW